MGRSLGLRLFAAACISTVVALVLAGIVLLLLFEKHVERRLRDEATIHLNQVIGGLSYASPPRVTFAQKLSDPRFEIPLSGLYWQIRDDERRLLLRSRSLWDTVMDLESDALAPGVLHWHEVPGPPDSRLLVAERLVLLGKGDQLRRLRVSVGVDREDLDRAVKEFGGDTLPYLVALAVFLVLAAALYIRVGLAPLRAVRDGVAAVRSGGADRLTGAYPKEVNPLIGEINELLESRERSIENARTWAADLAHGLKTPLTVMASDARRLREQGQEEIASGLEELADTMGRRVDRELIRARFKTGVDVRQARSDAGEAVQQVVRTLRRTPRGERLDWVINVPDETRVGVGYEDLIELLGNVIENAVEWAKARVQVTLVEGAPVRLRVDDDGPGIPIADRARAAERGARLDEQRSGTGLGLAIARDIAEAYGGELRLLENDEGGLRVEAVFPGSHSEPANVA
jgi:signal transduction histidine kinase